MAESLPSPPPRCALAAGLEISRIITGVWQIADMERGGRRVDPQMAASAMADYVDAGFDTFDMADHYGSPELIAGDCARRFGAGGIARPKLFTKWRPAPGQMTSALVRAGLHCT